MNWINLKDRLPKTEGEYLIFSKYEFKYEFPDGRKIDKTTYKIEIEEFTEDEFLKEWNNFVKTTGYEDKKIKQTITHWQPLPEAPK